jgi:type IV secretory pathway TrbD component
VIAAANSRAGRRARILGGTLAVLVGLRVRGWIGVGLAAAGALAAIPALWGFCL